MVVSPNVGRFLRLLTVLITAIVTASSAKKKKYDSKNLKTFSRWSIDGDHFTVETADNNNNKTLIIFIKRPFPRVQKVLYAVKI